MEKAGGFDVERVSMFLCFFGGVLRWNAALLYGVKGLRKCWKRGRNALFDVVCFANLQSGDVLEKNGVFFAKEEEVGTRHVEK